MTLVFVIVLGLILGMAFKQVRLGLLFGIIIGFLAMSLRRR
ncbi:hypothetical protein [Flaviaesturariibacter amylovorans]|uniref:DUF2273 domain-containing protein n=1 Tax=Flaviaesturariibacter amylovorans TaxID=1084520 RepID=A0ABP8H159_9BACT